MWKSGEVWLAFFRNVFYDDRSSRNFLQASKMITNRKYEDKYKIHPIKIINALSESKVAITYVVVDKYDFDSEFYGVYVMVLKLLQNISLTSPSTEVNVLVDKTSSISENDFEAFRHSMNGKRVKKCTKFNSSSSKYIQIADYVAGAIWHMYERNECKHFMIIRGSFALWGSLYISWHYEKYGPNSIVFLK